MYVCMLNLILEVLISMLAHHTHGSLPSSKSRLFTYIIQNLRYHKDISKRETARLLSGRKPGDFLVRDSTKNAGDSR